MRVLTEELREELRKPFGRIVSDGELGKLKAEEVIAVGDACAFAMIRMGVRPSLVIYDLKTKRNDVEEEVRRELEMFCAKPSVVKNEPGTIRDGLIRAVRAGLKKRGACIKVIGEEDLAALVVLIEAEKGLLVYGQPGVGAILVEINREARARAKGIFERMEKK